jgi:adenylate kinase
MDSGDLVPDDVIVRVIAERMQTPEAADGFILDGFPRTRPQAEALGRQLADLDRGPDRVLLIDASDEEVSAGSAAGAPACENGHVFHVDFNPTGE